MVGRSLDAHNECNAPALMEETPKALRVAVVEDDPRIQQLISAEITDEGHACICFGSAEDFLDEAGSDRFDLLLLDLMLPGMDGLACLKQLQLQAACLNARKSCTVFGEKIFMETTIFSTFTSATCVTKSNWTTRQPSSTSCAVLDSSSGNRRTDVSVSLGVALD